MTRSTSSGRPVFSDIDAYGTSHRGYVRKDNQDCFFVGALADRGGRVEAVTAEEERRLPDEVPRLASLGVVADGAGGVSDGAEAARVAVRELIAAVARLFEEGAFGGSDDPDAYSRLLQEAALDCHENLLTRARDEGVGRRFATTLTFFLGLWPQAYLLQVGDSRCYVFRDGALTQISRDQTIAQDLIDSGVMSRTVAERSRWSHVLSSAMGGQQAAPVVTRVERDRGTIIVICSDGLIRHVTDERIAERLASLSSSRQAAEQLVQDALDGGGTDNITVVIGRTLPPGDTHPAGERDDGRE
jgi:serine/threonine protein phosphatase PrpC